MSDPRVWAKVVEHLAKYAASRGISSHTLLDVIGCSPQQLADPAARLPLTAYYDTLEYAMQALGDPYFGLDYTASAGFATSDGLGFLAMFSPTVGEALTRFIRYLPVMNDSEQLIQFEIVDDRTSIFCTAWGPARPGKLRLVEMFATGFLTLPARITGLPIEILDVQFQHAPIAGTQPDEYRRWFGRTPTFEADDNVCRFPGEVMGRSLLQANEELARFFEAYLQNMLVGLHARTATDRVRGALEQGLATRHIGLQEIAQLLGVTDRTLQRQLAAEGTSFETILLELRRRLAEQYLREECSVVAVSERLGYTDPTGFQRAFKRWMGITPGEWREQQRRQQG